MVMEFEEMVGEEGNAMEQEKHELNRAANERKRTADQCVNKKNIVDEEHKKIKIERQNMIDNMTNRNLNMFFSSKLRHYFYSWREGHRRRKRAC